MTREEAEGPFFHGTRAVLRAGDLLVPGHPSHSRPGRALRHVYSAALLETAVWGAELAVALGGDGDGEVSDGEGHPPEVLEGMLGGLARLRDQGLDVIED